MQFLKSVLAGSLVGLCALTSLLLNSSAQEVPEPPRPAQIASSVLPCREPGSVADPNHRIRPKYPKASLKAGTEGAVELRVVVDSGGKIRDLRSVKGEPAFANPSVEAVRKWQFHPALVEGKPVETVYKVRVRFNLLLEEADTDWEIESPREGTDSVGRRDPSKFERETPDGSVYQAWKEYGVVTPKAIYSPEPEFSEAARRDQKQGTVTVGVIVGSDGIPKSTRVLCSSAPDLSENAVQAVKSWKFEPGSKDGKPVAVEIAVEVQFRLNQ